MTSPALAQSYGNPRTRYFVIEVQNTTETCSDRVYLYATSLNDCGDMVGYTSDSHAVGCRVSPWIWSYCGRWDLDAQTLYLLNETSTPGGPTPEDDGKAWGVNNNGDVVGEQYLSTTSTIAPFVWRFEATGLNSAFAIGDGNVTGVARSVSESDSSYAPYVSGTYKTGTFGSPSSRGFYHVLGQATSSLSILDPLSGGASTAFGVALAVGSSTAPLVGGSAASSALAAGFDTGGASPTGGSGSPPIDCGEDGLTDAVRWIATGTNVTPTAVREDFAASSQPLDLDAWNARIYSIDGLGQAAGAYIDPELVCLERACFWSASGEAVSLGLIAPLSVDSRSEAYSIAPADASTGSTLVVGDEKTEFSAGVVWWRAGSGGFDATLSTSLHLNDCDWKIQTISDVNAKGWMSATAVDGSEDNDLHAILLIPYGCPADLNLSGLVDASDFAILLGAWGSCGSSLCNCYADLDSSGAVDASDMALLLGDWDQTCSTEFCDGCNSEFSSEAQSQASTSGSLSLEVILGIAGQSSVADLPAWAAALTAEQRDQVASTIALLAASSGGDS